MRRTVSFEDIQKANLSINPMSLVAKVDKQTGEIIEKKSYAMVNDRVKAFRMVYPQGRISMDTPIIDFEKGTCIIIAHVYDENGYELASGIAQESRNASEVNQTSFVENCQTSAIGRALGFAGFGIDTGIASYEEVTNAQKQRKAQAVTTPTSVANVTPKSASAVPQQQANTQPKPQVVLQPIRPMQPAMQHPAVNNNQYTVRKASQNQIGYIQSLQKQLNMTDEILNLRIADILKQKVALVDLTSKQASAIIDTLNAWKSQPATTANVAKATA